ncbi:hypothetical protein B0F90DRAFT_631715 [Multifurca ochricompacta]|uniref:Uncharacterized protein n=1 Tax=Multifurca ochricompacta TaxID=376703 RepID=A0AAD4M3J9_9AGAM|nr:hypothetical protein B0F90DRAFT_631715 [Multifurca ochricompacta]
MCHLAGCLQHAPPNQFTPGPLGAGQMGVQATVIFDKPSVRRTDVQGWVNNQLAKSHGSVRQKNGTRIESSRTWPGHDKTREVRMRWTRASSSFSRVTKLDIEDFSRSTRTGRDVTIFPGGPQFYEVRRQKNIINLNSAGLRETQGKGEGRLPSQESVSPYLIT